MGDGREDDGGAHVSLQKLELETCSRLRSVGCCIRRMQRYGNDDAKKPSFTWAPKLAIVHSSASACVATGHRRAPVRTDCAKRRIGGTRPGLPVKP
jgi:hypothetical protein